MQTPHISSCAGASNESLWRAADGFQGERRCFLVEQRVVVGTAGQQSLHFYVDSFGEALATSDVSCDSGWSHDAIYLLSRHEGGRTQRSKVVSAVNLHPHGFLCRLENGLDVLAPYADEFGTFESLLSVGLPVYGPVQPTPPRERRA